MGSLKQFIPHLMKAYSLFSQTLLKRGHKMRRAKGV